MKGLRVDTFKIFNSRWDHRRGCRSSFKHNPGRAARPPVINDGEFFLLQWFIGVPQHSGPLPPVAATRYSRCLAGASVTHRACPNLKQVIPYGGP